MFPNPQDSLPLQKMPHVDAFQKHAQGLLRAAKIGEAAVADWSRDWIWTLVETANARSQSVRTRKQRWIQQFANYATAELHDKPTLAHAQRVIARSLGFATWRTLTAHLQKVSKPASSVAQFEAAVDAIVGGNLASLKQILARNPNLVHARSDREHHATLLHYVAANGVEGYRQRTPRNIVKIAALLLDHGAKIDATCEVYGGQCTTMGLAATSVHPANAGVMNDLLQLLLDYGAAVGRKGSGGNNHSLVFACLANGRLESARFLAAKGAHLDIISAAALDDLARVKENFHPDGSRKSKLSRKRMHEAFRYACGYGANRVVEFLIERGADLTEHSGDGQTGIHYTVIFGRLDTLKLLLKYKPPLELQNMYGGTILGQTLWSAAHGGDPQTYSRIIETLIAAGAHVPELHVPVNPQIDALLIRHGSRPEPKWWWYGEEISSSPASRKNSLKR